MRDRNIFLSDITFPSWPGKSINPNIRKFQPCRKNDIFDCCFEIQSKTAARNDIHIYIRYFKALVIATYYKRTIHIKNICLHSKANNLSFKRSLYLTSLSCRGLVNSSTATFRNISLTEKTTYLIAWKFN